jgi:hypothetical protein
MAAVCQRGTHPARPRCSQESHAEPQLASPSIRLLLPSVQPKRKNMPPPLPRARRAHELPSSHLHPNPATRSTTATPSSASIYWPSLSTGGEATFVVSTTVAMGLTSPEPKLTVVALARALLVSDLLPRKLCRDPRKLILSSVGVIRAHRHRRNATGAPPPAIASDERFLATPRIA